MSRTDSNSLEDALHAYEKLLHTEYIFVIKVGKLEEKEIHLKFKKENFFHLTGCQHLKDIRKILFRSTNW